MFFDDYPRIGQRMKPTRRVNRRYRGLKIVEVVRLEAFDYASFG
jgi:hypothetical protein